MHTEGWSTARPKCLLSLRSCISHNTAEPPANSPVSSQFAALHIKPTQPLFGVGPRVVVWAHLGHLYFEGGNCRKDGVSPPVAGGRNPFSRIILAGFPGLPRCIFPDKQLTRSSIDYYHLTQEFHVCEYRVRGSGWALHTVRAPRSQVSEVLVSLLGRRSWKYLFNPGAQPWEHKEPLTPQKKTSSKLIK